MPRASTTLRFSRMVGSMTHASMPASSTMRVESLVAGGRGQAPKLAAIRARRCVAARRPYAGRWRDSARWCASSTTTRRRHASSAQRVAMKLQETPASPARCPTRRSRSAAIKRSARSSLSIEPLARKTAQAERVEATHECFELIVRQRAQRIDDQRLRPAPKAPRSLRVLEAERFAASRSQHRQRVLPASTRSSTARCASCGGRSPIRQRATARRARRRPCRPAVLPRNAAGAMPRPRRARRRC